MLFSFVLYTFFLKEICYGKFNNDLDKKHNYEVYTDKASKFLTFSIVLLALSLTSYLFALLVFDNFDFGFIFELFAFVCVVVAKNALIDKKLSLSKKNYYCFYVFSWLASCV